MNVKNKNIGAYLWTGLAVVLGVVLVGPAAAPSFPTWGYGLAAAFGGVFLASLFVTGQLNWRSKTSVYGSLNAVVVVLVLAIIALVNVGSFNFTLFRVDLTSKSVHTLSDQSIKAVKGITQDIQVRLFFKGQGRDEFRPLLENYSGANPKFKVESIDVDRFPSRATQAGIRKVNSLQITLGERSVLVDDITEEKVTNTLIQLSKNKERTLCFVTGHGEVPLDATEAEGLSLMKTSLEAESYQSRELSLTQEGKVPAECAVLAIVGPHRAFLPQESKLISEFLGRGGRALIAVTANSLIAPGDTIADITAILKPWYVRPSDALVVDPVSRIFGAEPTMPFVSTYSATHAVTKAFDKRNQSLFPASRPLEILDGAPAEIKVEWIGRTLESAWGETDLAELKKGRVKNDPNVDKKGPVNLAVAIEGKQKDSKAEAATRVIVFGTSLFASNQFVRQGSNADFLMNSVNWLMEDENFISIRPKEEDSGSIELTEKEGRLIFLGSVLFLPGLITVAGITNWVRRKKL